MSTTVFIVVNLYARPGAELALRDYETAAAGIMDRYGGVIESVIAPQSVLHDGRVPTEIHVLRFPNSGAFDLYRADPDLTRIAGLREAAIEHTEIFIGHPGTPYQVR